MRRNYQKESLSLHKKARGKIEVTSKVPIRNKEDLSLAYTPGVAGPSLAIARNNALAYDLTSTKNSVAIISDGSAVLGLGNIGPEAALPVMEGKAILFKRFAGIDGFPIVLGTQDTEEIISAIKAIAPTFGGINLEDISAPRCFEIEARLKKELSIPVMHDDQHGTAVVVLAGLINSLKIAGKRPESTRVVINGAGAAGVGIATLLYQYGFRDMVVCDTQGVIHKKRPGLSPVKKALLKFTNPSNLSGTLHDTLRSADVFIGVSQGNILTTEDISSMNSNAIIFALSNPTPEIMPDKALKGDALVVATGRSDLPNQVNNALAYPGIFKGALEVRAQITDKMKIAAAEALASMVKKPAPDQIIPSLFDKQIVPNVCNAVKRAARSKK